MVFQSEQQFELPNKDICSWIFDEPSYDQDKPIYIDAADPSKTISFRQAKTYIRQLIKGFQNRGLQKGDTVCLIAFNNIFYTMVWYAVIGAGGRFVGTNPSYKVEELEHLFHLADAKFVITEPSLFEKVHKATQSSNIPDTSVFQFAEKEDCVEGPAASFRTLMEEGEADWYRFDSETEQANTVAVLAQTSGTTGLPKAAQLSHRSFVAYSIQGKDRAQKPYEPRVIVTLPSFHAFASPIVHLLPLKWGVETYIVKRYEFKSFMNTIEQNNITEIPLAPPIINDMLRDQEFSGKALQGVRWIFWGGAGMTQERLNNLRAICHPEAVVGANYGMTEIGCICMADFFEKNSGNSVGRLMPGNEVKIVDEDGNILTAPDAYGELYVRGPTLMMGYLGNEQASKEAIEDGWLKTGDIGRQENGLFFIEDRAKDLIKVRGWQVSPTELEQGLIQHPKIKDAAVLGVDLDDGQGEVPKAFVVRHAVEELITEKEIHAFVNVRFASYKRLAGGIEFVDAIPRNPSGKILKRELRAKSAATAAAPAAPAVAVVPATPVAPVEVAVNPVGSPQQILTLLLGSLRVLLANTLFSLLPLSSLGLAPVAAQGTQRERAFNPTY